MEFDKKENEMVLSNGRRFYAHSGVIGIGAELKAFYGFDGNIETTYGPPAWTQAERDELSDHMIDLWTRFKRGHEQHDAKAAREFLPKAFQYLCAELGCPAEIGPALEAASALKSRMTTAEAECERLRAEVEAHRDPHSVVANYLNIGRELDLDPQESIFEGVKRLRDAKIDLETKLIEEQTARRSATLRLTDTEKALKSAVSSVMAARGTVEAAQRDFAFISDGKENS